MTTMAERAAAAVPSKEQLEAAQARLRRLQAKVDVRGRSQVDDLDPATAIDRLRRLEARLDARRGGR